MRCLLLYCLLSFEIFLNLRTERGNETTCSYLSLRLKVFLVHSDFTISLTQTLLSHLFKLYYLVYSDFTISFIHLFIHLFIHSFIHTLPTCRLYRVSTSYVPLSSSSVRIPFSINLLRVLLSTDSTISHRSFFMR